MSQYQQTYDKEKVSFSLARLKKGGDNFEVVLEDVDKALDLRGGKDIKVSEAIKSEEIFRDAKKGMLAPEESMKKWLGTINPIEVAKIIIQKGEVHLTAEQRAKIFERKKKEILNYIHQNAADPKSGLPHPMTRIELAMKEAKINIDPSDRVDFQIQKIIPKLQAIIPMSFDKLTLKIVIPAKSAGSAYSAMKGKHKLLKEIWRNDGSIQFEMSIVAGAKSDVFSLLNKLTNGEVEITEVK